MIPTDLGILGYEAFREEQQRAIQWLTERPERFPLMTLPPGVGKSLVAMAYVKLMDMRGVLLTSTLGLMDQYSADHRQNGLLAVKGLGNYPCRALGGGFKCDSGPCLDGESCQWRDEGCEAFDAVRFGGVSDLAISNYSWWFSHRAVEPLGPRDILICDEAHEIATELSRASGASFHSGEVQLRREMGDWALIDWQAWAIEKREKAQEMLGKESLGYSERRRVRSLWQRFDRVAESINAPTGWAHDWSEGRKGYVINLEPVDPGPYAEQLLFRGIKKVVLMSATAREITLKDLGVDPSQYALIETDSPFPVERRPIYHQRVGLRINGKTSDDGLEHWVRVMDWVMGPRLALKGIIHTVSYRRARFIQEHSKFGKYMIINDSDNTRATVERFKRAPVGQPAILVSPSVDTGWNFPYDAARWQIISKVPYPDTRYGIAKARQEADPQYDKKHAIAKIQQMAGRVMRDKTDWGETIIADDGIGWLFRSFKPWFARWFRQAFQTVDQVPMMDESIVGGVVV